MKIKSGGVGPIGYDRLGAGKRANASKAGAAERSSGQPKDDVALSVEAKRVAQIGERIQSAPDIRMEKVAPLKASIAEGRYQTDSLKAADMILREVLLEQKQTLR